MKKIVLGIIFIGFLIFIIFNGYIKKQDYSQLSFNEVCKSTGGMWMKMQPTKDFIPTGEAACEGCMQRNGDHICVKESYLDSLK